MRTTQVSDLETPDTNYFISCLLIWSLVGLQIMLSPLIQAQDPTGTFHWPEGKEAALSLSFDDARISQMEVGLALFKEFNTKVTFYVLSSAVEPSLEPWKQAVAQGHEIGNHSLRHPCTGNFLWSRENALENYSIEEMEKELREANQQIEKLLGVTPRAFAYPCGQTFIGRGTSTASYVPLVAQLFASGRGWLSESPNDPAFCDLSQLTGMSMDAKDFEQLLPLLQQIREQGLWLVLAGHEIGAEGPQTTRVTMLKQLMEYAHDPAHGLWLAPVGTITNYIENHRN